MTLLAVPRPLTSPSSKSLICIKWTSPICLALPSEGGNPSTKALGIVGEGSGTGKGGFLSHYLIQWVGLLSLCDLKRGPWTRAEASLVLLSNTETTSPRTQWTRICSLTDPGNSAMHIKVWRHCLLSQWGKVGVAEVSGVCSQQHLVQTMELADGRASFRGLCGEVAWTENGSMTMGLPSGRGRLLFLLWV